MNKRSRAPGIASVAAIDLGTNAFRLLIADVGQDGELTIRHTERTIPRLGTGIGGSGRLDPVAVERSLEALWRFHAVVDSHRVDAVVVAATSAVREASNAAEFLQRVKTEIGFDIEVISGQEEARRTWLGARAGLSGTGRPISDAVILDIGGGSTEIIRVRHGAFERAVSLDLGVVKLTERYLHHDPPLPAEVADLEATILHTLRETVSLNAGSSHSTLVGTAGTVTSAAAVYLKLTSYHPSLVHDTEIPREAVVRIAKQLERMTSLERRRIPSVGRGREDVIVAGLSILCLALELFGLDRVVVSEYGLREGLIVDWVERCLPRIPSVAIRICPEPRAT